MCNHDGQRCVAAVLGAVFGVGSGAPLLKLFSTTQNNSPFSSSVSGGGGVLSGCFTAGRGGAPNPLAWLVLVCQALLRWRKDCERVVGERVANSQHRDELAACSPLECSPMEEVQAGATTASRIAEEGAGAGAGDGHVENTTLPSLLPSSSSSAGADRVRHSFSSACASLQPHGSCPPLLWRLWARFEASTGRWGSCRRVLLQGLSSCPWSKALLLDAASLDNTKAAAQREARRTAAEMLSSPSSAGGVAVVTPAVFLPDALSKHGLRRAFEAQEVEQLLENAQERGLTFRTELKIGVGDGDEDGE